ncbi:MAG: imidazole glycerol phosphate synthase subunit HisH [Coriobacteriales bacterium]|jgi:glutamine amidotransferase|nr:imidazole glycerol phosphate synthase subunit HisH [Coriobacteriales bacterium]
MSFVIIDYSKGNLRSVQKGLELAGCESLISARAADIRAAEALVLPGVGAFADASAHMMASGQMQAIQERIAAGVAFLGICLGLQLLFERGDEGMPSGEWAPGLAVLDGYCRRIDALDAQGHRVKVPHVGWNQVVYGKDERLLAPLCADIADGSNFYFTHSYQCVPACPELVLATVCHAQEFACVVRREQVFGVQFHPEKSSQKGLAVLRNFVRFVTEINGPRIYAVSGGGC